MTTEGKALQAQDWEVGLRGALGRSPGSVDILGVGNPIRGDDGVGLVIASQLRRILGARPSEGFRIHRDTLSPERLLSKLAASAGRIVIFDAVEATRAPGDIVCCRLRDSRYGYFATHNIPLRLIPGLESRVDDIYIVGVQPLSVGVGEGLSDVVRDSAARIVAAVTDAVGGKP